MCSTSVLIYLFRICCILQIDRLSYALKWIFTFRPVTSALFLVLFLICYFLSLAYEALTVTFILAVAAIIFIVLPGLFSCLQWAIDESKTHGVEPQRIGAGFLNRDPDPEAPMLPAAQQTSIIRTPEPTAVWSTEPLRQQPALDEEDVREVIYKRMQTTRRPRQSYKQEKRNLPIRESQGSNTAISRRRTRSSTLSDIQQSGPSSENPCVVNIVPEIHFEPPTDTSESSETVDEAGQDRHLLSVLPYPTVRRSVQTRQDSTQRATELSADSQSPSKELKDSKFSRIKKRLGISDAATATTETSERSEKSLKPEEFQQFSRFSLAGPSSQQADYIIHAESSSQTKISGSEHDSLFEKDRSPSRSSDTGTGETTLSDRSESPGSSRHSSPGDGRRTPKFEDSPKLHKSRSRKNS